MDWLTFLVPRQLYSGSSRYSDSIEVVVSFGNRKLLVNGITQSGRYPTKLFQRGLQTLQLWHEGPMKQILVLGIGGGDIFHLLRKQYSRAHLCGIDIDAKIVQLGKKYFGLRDIPNTTYIVADAKKFSKRQSQKKIYDCVIIDLYIGNSVPDFVISKGFFKDVKRLLRPGGSIMFNFFSYTHQPDVKQEILFTLKSIFPNVVMKSNRRNIFFFGRS